MIIDGSGASLCALCRRHRALCNSHVIPEFMYAPLYDDKHRFHMLSTKDRHQYGQKGVRERLLCEECEQQFSKHETYVSNLFKGLVPVESRRDGRLVKISGIDYRSFKLFALSVLWRASVSSNRLFSEVNLGPHQEEIRRRLQSDDPGPNDRYGVSLSPLVRGEKEAAHDLIVQPTRSRVEGHLCYRFVFGGLIWVFVVSNHSAPKVFRHAFVQEGGELIMLPTEVSDATFIVNAFRDILRT